ncbi:hypothetical protein SRABI128_06301 [Microbacterium sp. Bi128]|nr:hypothetical protein SRABI128_06301 [Microbacterium sp. Bi128]
MGDFLDQAGCLVDFEEAKVRAALDGQQHAVRAVDRCFQQRGGDGQLRGLHGAVFAAGRTDAHQRGTGTLHDGLDVGEVEVDQAGGGDEVRDALDTGEQDLVGGTERVQDGDVAVADGEQAVVRDHDQGVDFIAQGVDAGLGGAGTAAAFKREGARHDADGQGAKGPCDPGDDGGAAGSGSAAFAGGDEDHVCAPDDLFDFIGVVLRGLPANFRVRASTESTGQLTPDVELDVGIAHQQCLGIGVDGDEFDAAKTDLDHAVDCVHATAADADDLDDGQVILRSCHVTCPLFVY